MDSIGIYIPGWWLRIADKSDRIFVNELFKTIKNSGCYKLLLLNLPRLRFSSQKEAMDFCHRKNLVLILQHDSPFLSFHPLVSNLRYKENVKLLENCVPFVNSFKAQERGYNKITTKNILNENGLPVLDDKIVTSLQDLENHIEEGKYYVIKPPDRGAGTGVKLIKKEGANYLAYYNSEWRKIKITDKKLKNKKDGLSLNYSFNFLKSPLLTFKKIQIDFIYHLMLVEPYFNDKIEEFSSLRCTVIGDEIVEVVKRTNRKNITSNISCGGRVEKFELSDYQKKIAVAAKNAIGADYAGVDFLISNKKTVIGEVNIGPFGLWCQYSGVNVGKILADYLIKKCDELKR